MSKMSVELLSSFINKRFEHQRNMLPLWQTIADNFYPERADFTTTRNVGAELANNLSSSYPIIVRRDLGNAIAAMMRDGNWMKMATARENVDHEAKQWLQWAGSKQLKMMNHISARFDRATKEADHDFVAFGQPVISVDKHPSGRGVLYRTWHLRDCAWWDDEQGQVAGMCRRWKSELFTLIQYFGKDRLDPAMVREAEKNYMREQEVYHVVMPIRMYWPEYDGARKYVSLYFDMKNKHIIEEVFQDRKIYVVPRFSTIAGSAYAYSPAVIAGLPEARLMQAITHVMMEAGERYVRPPLVGTAGVIKGGVVNLRPDGVTWADAEYDETKGPAIRPLDTGRSGNFPIGMELRQDVVEILSSAFYLNKLSLPETTHEMTAYEVQERMKQFRRENLPLFSPIESTYNGPLCEETFDELMAQNAFGSPYDLPKDLRGAEVQFKFESPLSSAEEERKITTFQQMSATLKDAAEHDPMIAANVDIDVAVRDAIQGMGAPEKWLRGVEQVLKIRQQAPQQQVA